MSHFFAHLTPPWRSALFAKWHTVFDSGDLCAKHFSFSCGARGGVAHGLRFRGFVCHGFFIFLRSKRRSGTRFSIPGICVPRIFHFKRRVAHKKCFRRFVCQNLFTARLKDAAVWHTNRDFSNSCAIFARGPIQPAVCPRPDTPRYSSIPIRLLTVLAEPCPVDPEAEGRIGNKIDVLAEARRKACRAIGHREGIASRLEGKRVVEAR